MDKSVAETATEFRNLRHHNSAWQLMASRRAPLILACLTRLYNAKDASIPTDELEQSLAEMLEEHADVEEFGVEDDNYLLAARRELRNWIKRRLIVERDGLLTATDELQQTLRFVESMQDRIMTSTASRLATVQREIENVAMRLSHDQANRERALQSRIDALTQELERVSRGEFEVLAGREAEEAIRDIFDLASSLRADFRRVEDSFREADKALRRSVISEGRHRGEIVDTLLDAHDALQKTSEGMTFLGFHEQLVRSVELARMRRQLKEIATSPAAHDALTVNQQTDLRLTMFRLMVESDGIMRARAASERDVKSFIKTGLAAEHYRVGQLINDLLETATRINWALQTVRRTPVSLPAIGVAANNLPVIERLRLKSLDDESAQPLSLMPKQARLDEFEEDFWASLDTLDRHELFQQTCETLEASQGPMTVGEVATALRPAHDLESIAFWISLARVAGLPFSEDRETFVTAAAPGQAPEERSGLVSGGGRSQLRFTVPRVDLTASALKNLDWDI
ncbi:MAG: DUF3375 family protein [Proteobacteria bacterium]|jgi:hypothetical protein|nr:DUF3375 family protein [Pseudomonadota bacterium]